MRREKSVDLYNALCYQLEQRVRRGGRSEAGRTQRRLRCQPSKSWQSNSGGTTATILGLAARDATARQRSPSTSDRVSCALRPGESRRASLTPGEKPARRRARASIIKFVTPSLLRPSVSPLGARPGRRGDRKSVV